MSEILTDFASFWKLASTCGQFHTPGADEHEFIFNKVRRYLPRTLIEIGTCLGGTTLTLHKAAPTAKLWTFDVRNVIEYADNALVGSYTKHLIDTKYVTYRTGSTSADMFLYHEFAWIDGSHHSPEVLLDTLNCLRFATYPYTLLYHDIGLDAWGGPYLPDYGATQVWKAWQKVAPTFGATLDLYKITGCVHFPTQPNLYQLTQQLMTHWRLGKEMDDIVPEHLLY